MSDRKHHVLVVEDEPVSREMLADFLKKEGFLVSKAKNGLQMKSVLVTSRVRVDLILLDIGLPGKDGLQLAKELRSRSDVGIIFVTGKTSKEDRIEGLETGGDDYITKPYDEQELLARAHAVIRRSTAVSAHTTQENFTDLTPNELAEDGEDEHDEEGRAPLPVNIAEFINTSGRLSFVDLQSVAQRHSKRIFSRLLVRPVLKGVGLVSGIAMDEVGGDGSTKIFRMNAPEGEMEIKTSKAAAETIYPFIKRVGAKSPGSIYTAGRTFDNLNQPRYGDFQQPKEEVMASADEALRTGEAGNTFVGEGKEPSYKPYRVSEAIFVFLLAVALIGVPWWIVRYDARQATQAGSGLVLNLVARNDMGRTGEWLARPAGNWNYAREGAASSIQVRKGEEVTLRLTSIDVEHEFSLPAYNIKAKVAPGKVTTIRFVAGKAGVFKYECTSFCRDGHNDMAGRLVVTQTTANR